MLDINISTIGHHNQLSSCGHRLCLNFSCLRPSGSFLENYFVIGLNFNEHSLAPPSYQPRMIHWRP